MNLAAIAFLASSVFPLQPTSFETVTLRIDTDACNFEPATVRVTMSANVIRVTQGGNACSPPGAPIVAEVQLGAFPSGDYRVDLYPTLQGFGTPTEQIAFQVRDAPHIAVTPTPPRPLANYTALWYNAQESGWGLSLYQGPTFVLFGLLFVYDSANRPEWYSVQVGHWTSSTAWTGTLVRTTGPSFSGPFISPPVTYAVAGTASLDFTQAPGQEGRAQFTYSIGNTTVTKTITRLPL